ncbi:hypothetical protein, partial [Klebsiella pneumoniae]|uniref:hypothetical protein n=1 Tax=Klebsiella pneumoniae TaxID=573 RepID=UPI003EE03872
MGAPGGSLGTAGGPNTAGTQGQPEDSYPVIGTLESSVFGSSTPQAKIEDRLAKLENAVYKKTFALESLFDRTER